jgi:hypothetical protein
MTTETHRGQGNHRTGDVRGMKVGTRRGTLQTSPELY